VQDLTEWVQYVNFEKNSPMSNLRQQNGREKPWNVKFWGVGNEAWGCGGNMKPDYYANIYRQYSTFMNPQVGKEKIFRIASGASSDDFNWTETLMKNIPVNMVEGVAMHHYSTFGWDPGVKGSATDFTEAQYFRTMQQALKMDEYIQKHSAIMDKYDPQKKVALVVDEWGAWYEVEPGTNPGFLYQQNTMRDAIVAALNLHIFFRHADRVRMTNIAQMANVLQAMILTREGQMVLTPTYHVFAMYKGFQDATFLPLELKSPWYNKDQWVVPSVSGAAARGADGVVRVAMTNVDPNRSASVSLSVDGVQATAATGQLLTAATIQSHNDFGSADVVKPAPFTGATVAGGSLSVTLPPKSVVVLELR
jgi:alpha-N-arabinofuranosidase